MARSLPADDITPIERYYLENRFADHAMRQEHEERLRMCLRRFVRRGVSAEQLHSAVSEMTKAWFRDRVTRTAESKARTRDVARARAAIARAAASLRRLTEIPPEIDGEWMDEWLIDNRDNLLDVRENTTPRRPGRPWAGKRELDAALRTLKVPASDRRELSAALGLISDDG